MRTTSGSISKNVQVSPSRRWQARLPVPSPTAATRASLPRAARTASMLSRDRPAEIVIGQRLRRRSCRRVVVAHPLGAVHRGAVIEQAVAAVGGLDHLMHAEEAARGLDAVEAGLPERGQRRRRERRARRSAPAAGVAAASRRPARPARSGTAVRPRPAGGCRTQLAPRLQTRRPAAPARRRVRNAAHCRRRDMPGSASRPRRSGSDTRRRA